MDFLFATVWEAVADSVGGLSNNRSSTCKPCVQ